MPPALREPSPRNRFLRRHFQSVPITFLTLCAVVVSAPSVWAEDEGEAFFETKIRPLLAEHCFECHGPEKQQGDVRLDRKSLAMGEDADYPVIQPGKLEDSRMWQVLQYDPVDTQMPPKGKLSDGDLALIKQWIEYGAPWPDDETVAVTSLNAWPHNSDGAVDFAAAAEQHWAFQKVELPEIPALDGLPENANPVDRFVLARLQDQQLSFSEQADRRTLIRRLSFDLRGIPPTFEEVEAFLNDNSSDAWGKLVDQFLASPLYGQRWGRIWLDVARYADTKGYVFTENHVYPYAYTYRDYVVQALNNDLPYDQFLIEQIAADQLDLPENDPRLAAMGFLTVGPRYLNREPDIIDDRIDVVTRGLMGLTVACARCHDHKFDPIPTADYYSLYGVFASSQEPELPPLVGEIDEQAPGYAEFVAELNKREQAVEDYMDSAHQDLLRQAADFSDDYLLAAAQKLEYLPADREIAFEHGNPRERITRLWERFLKREERKKDPVFRPWEALLQIPEADLPAQSSQTLAELRQIPEVPAGLLEALEQANLQTREDVIRVYGDVFIQTVAAWYEATKADPATESLPDPGQEAIRRQLFGPQSLTDVPRDGDRSPLFERDNRDKIRELERQVDDWQVNAPGAPARAMVLQDREQPREPVIFVRGNPGRRGDQVPRRAPQILGAEASQPFDDGSGRLELARHIASPENPLTARVIVNRVWMQHFGTGLVNTPSDFGARSDPPSHPELLDFLAWSFTHPDGWSLKALHRRILLSQTYQQASVDRPECRKVDPENRLYWKQNRQRLDFEPMRDALLAAAGQLDTSLGGRPVDLESQPYTHRRAIYGFVDRNNLPGLFRTFDFPSPDLSSPERAETTVPQQALVFMNSDFVQQIAQLLAERVQQQSDDPTQQPDLLVKDALSRPITPQERELMGAYLQHHSLADLAQAVLMTNEFLFID